MAKSVKDITTWTGGVSNAVEPSDAGDDSNSTAILKNLDGTTKKGVLRPSGSMVDFDTRLAGFDLSATEYGKGFEIMPLDYDLGDTVILETDSSTDFSTADIVGTISTSDGTIDTGALYTTQGSIKWIPSTNANCQSNLPFDGTNGPSFDADQWYSFECDYHPSVNNNWNNALQDYTWMTVSSSAFGSGDHMADHWSSIGVSSSTGASRRIKTVFKAEGDGKIFGLAFSSGNTASGNTLEISNLKWTKLSTSQSNEVQFIQHYDGTDSKINLYQEGASSADPPVIGTHFKQLNLGPADAANAPDISYLKGSNSMRISDGNFENTYNPKFFGFIDREFFSGTSTNLNSLLTLDSETHRGIKRKYWVEEDAKLIAPHAASCTMPCLGDIIAHQTVNSNVTDADMYWHNDLLEETESLAPNDAPYLLRLEYAVVKDHHTNSDGSSDQPGNWNPAEDGQVPANVTTEEKRVKYHFYCTFVYDRGAQESEMTQIRKIPYQGFLWNGSAYNGDANRLPANWAAATNGEIDLMFHDSLSHTVRATGQNYDNEYAWDCAVKFRATIMVSDSGSCRWGLPERCTGVNWYYSTSEDAHNKRYKLVETDFVDGVKYHSSDTSDWTEWTCFQTNADTTAKLPVDGGNPIRWFYSSNSSSTDGMVTIKDPPQGEDWDSMYGMKSNNWPDIQYKCSTIVGGQAFYGHVKIGSETHRDRVLVSIGNHGYDMIPDDNYLEVVPGDGDEIVELLSYSNQLYVFKKNKVVVCDVGGEEDKVAAEHLVGGIQERSQACVTSKGVFWVNKHGAYLSTGGDVESKILGKIDVEHLSADATTVTITTVAGSKTVTNVANAAIVKGAEVYHTCFPGGVTRVDSVTSSTEFEAEDAAIVAVTGGSADCRAGSTDCMWSLRDDDIPYIGYNPMEEQVFIVNSSKPGVKKHFWKYDLKEDSFWYHDGDYVTIGTGGTTSSSGTPNTISYATNDEVKVGMYVSDALGHLGSYNWVTAVAANNLSCTVSAASTGTSSGGNTFYFTGGSFRTIDQSTNFGLNKDLRLTGLNGANQLTALASGYMTYWDKTPSPQNIWYDTGFLDLGSPSTYKQLYKISVVAKNSNSNVYLYMYGISPNQPDGSFSDMDEPFLFPLATPNALNTNKVFRKTDHKPLNILEALYVLSSKSLFFKVIMRTGTGPMPKDFELNSLSMVYRDRGIKGQNTGD